MKRLMGCDELTLSTRRELFKLMNDYYEKYKMEERLISRYPAKTKDAKDICIEFRDRYGKTLYVLLNSIEFNIPGYLYNEFDIKAGLPSNFKEMYVNEENYIGIVEELLETYRDIYCSCKSKDRRIKKSDSENTRMALQVNRKVIKRQEKRIRAIEEYLGVLRVKLK